MSRRYRPADPQHAPYLPPKRLTPGCVVVKRPVSVGDRRVDADEAARSFADRPWAKAVRYLGVERGMHCWERKL